MSKSTPKLTIDVHPLFDEQWTGIPIFTQRLIQALLRDGRVKLEFCVEGTRVPSDAVLAAIRAGTGAALHDHCSSHRLPRLSRREHLLVPTVKRSFERGRCEASTVHDLSTLLMPETHEAANVRHHTELFVRELATDAAVFCTSEATRAALVSAYPSVKPKARVLYQYVEWPEEFKALDRNSPALALGLYAVVVGTLEPRKNLGLLLRALNERALKRSALRFVIIGRKGWLMDSFLSELTPKQRQRLLFTGYVSEFIKYRLIRHAQFLVYPSLYEGFGIPALEAMSLGVPVLAARSSSFPEVIGKAGIYFDPLSVREFAAAFAEIQHARRLKELAAKARVQSQRFGWQQMAAPVLEWLKA